MNARAYSLSRPRHRGPIMPGVDRGRAVLAEVARLERVAADLEPVVSQLVADATAVAAEHGHELGPWIYGEGLVVSARCTRCTATVAHRAEGHGSNDGQLRFLTMPCAALRPRFYAVKSGRGYFVRDRERAAYAGRMAATKGKAAKLAATLNAEAAGEAPAPSELQTARARVDRARASLARAETALAKLTGEAVPAPVVALAVTHAPLDSAQDGALVVAHFSAPMSSGPLRPLARPGSGFVKAGLRKRGR